MVKIDGNEIYRDYDEIGSISDKYIYDHSGDKIGYFEENYVYDRDGNKQAYIEGGYLISYNGGSLKIPLDKINESIEGGVVSEIGKCAIYILLGN